MVKLKKAICQLEKRTVLVVGDLMLDTYTTGRASRISPEAPVAVLHVQSEKSLPGGAGNVALNLKSLGAEVVLMGRLGDDYAGSAIRQAFAGDHIDMKGVLNQKGFSTPVKNRVIADNQQLIRIDYEQVQLLDETLEAQLIQLIPHIMQGVDVVAISDYGKGFLSDRLLSELIAHANSLNLPIIADPKGKYFRKYNGVTILKPNLGEAYAAAEMTADATLDDVAQEILKNTSIEMLMITRSKDGISIFEPDQKRKDYPVTVHEIKDVTGAGDTVLATMTYAIANKLPMDLVVSLSNVAAGIAIERIGCARVSLTDLVRRLIEQDVHNKIFDDEHSFALQHALKARNFQLLGLSSSEGMTSPMFSVINQLGSNRDVDLIIYFLDETPNEEFIRLLSSIQSIKFIILHLNQLHYLCEQLEPVAMYTLSNHTLIPLENSNLKNFKPKTRTSFYV